MKAAIYARYSTDKQSATSIEDQIQLVKARLEAQGHKVVDIFSDHAMSGSSAARPDFQRMMDAVKSGHADFDMIAAEALDRLSRNQADIARLYEDLTYLDIKLWTAEEGEVDELHIGLKGTMNALFLKTLKEKIRRGQAGQVRRGKAPCNKAYGYDVVKEFDAKGELIRGERKINEAEAKVVQEIFDDYASGISPRAIAKKLNDRGISSPQGGIWRASTINGNRKRKMGFLHNELYIGKLIYNRVRMVKDPNTGKRVSRSNPESEWVTENVPHLRIIDQVIWDKVQERKEQYASFPLDKTRREKTLLQGLVHCHECGGRYTQKSRTYLYCSNAKEAGTCSNKRGISKQEIEERIVLTLLGALKRDEFADVFIEEFEAEVKKLNENQPNNHKSLSNELKVINIQIERLVNAIMNGTDSPSIHEKIKALSAEQENLQTQLAKTCQNKQITLPYNLHDHYQQSLNNLGTMITNSDQPQARNTVRSLIEKITIKPKGKRGENDIILDGDLNGAINLITNDQNIDCTRLVVAEEGFEPPTHGL